MAIATKAAPALPRRPGQNRYADLQNDTVRELVDLARQLHAGKLSTRQWYDDFSNTLARRHKDAWVLGRWLGGDDSAPDSIDDLIGRAKADAESQWLRSFLSDLETDKYKDGEGIYDLQRIAWRSRLYAGKLRGTANEAFVTSSDSDAEFEWILGGVEDHCSECPQYAEMSPWKKDEMFTWPCDGRTPCRTHCKCHLVRHDGVAGFRPVKFDSSQIPSKEQPALPGLGVPASKVPNPPADGRNVGEAFDFEATERAGRAMKYALKAIDEIHTDGRIPDFGFLNHEDVKASLGYMNYGTQEVWINPVGMHPELTACHECGHVLDFYGVGNGSTEVERNKVFAGFRKAVEESGPHQFLKWSQMQDVLIYWNPKRKRFEKEPFDYGMRKYVEYLLKWEELWARAYAQYVVLRSGKDRLNRQLKRTIESIDGVMFRTQWTTSEFAPIAEEIDKILKELGWRD